jgi:hypothetical protein
MAISSLLASPDASWCLSLYPDAAEGSCVFRPSLRAPRMYVPPGYAANPERARAEAARRAKTKLRRYAVANRLDRFGTLTYAGAGCQDPRQARADVAVFMRQLRTALGGRPLPYVWVPEWHKTGHGVHLHFALSKYVRYTVIRSVWDHGNISIKRITGQRHGASKVEGSRIAAGYLSKYLAKTFESPELGGLHRYEVAQGFQPKKLGFTGTHEGEVLDAACEVMGSSPTSTWSSDESTDWQAPPARSYRWG